MRRSGSLRLLLLNRARGLDCLDVLALGHVSVFSVLYYLTAFSLEWSRERNISGLWCRFPNMSSYLLQMVTLTISHNTSWVNMSLVPPPGGLLDTIVDGFMLKIPGMGYL